MVGIYYMSTSYIVISNAAFQSVIVKSPIGIACTLEQANINPSDLVLRNKLLFLGLRNRNDTGIATYSFASLQPLPIFSGSS